MIEVVKYEASWCGPCLYYKPIFEAVAEKYGDRARFTVVDVDNPPNNRTKSHGIRSIPTTVILKEDGQIIQSLIGIQSEKDLEKALNEALVSEN